MSFRAKIEHLWPVFDIALVHYVGVGFLIMVGLFIYLVLYPYQINSQAKLVLEGLTLGYLVIAPFYYFWLARQNKISAESPSRTFLAARFFWQLPLRLPQILFRRNKMPSTLFPDILTKQAVLSVLVKFFFAPLMISFFFLNIDRFTSSFSQIMLWMDGYSAISMPRLWRHLYLVLVNALLILDTIIFAFAYLVESDRLGNRVRSVEPTLVGWASALICYPPFNFLARQSLVSIGGPAINSSRNPVMDFQFLIVSQAIALIFLAIYVWASVALGTRAGNLTNRGIVAVGPYRYIRHPAYTAKNLSWFFELLPFLYHPIQLVFWTIWAGIYIARAVTEERHLSKDPSYLAYRQQVPYRFIPRLV